MRGKPSKAKDATFKFLDAARKREEAARRRRAPMSEEQVKGAITLTEDEVKAWNQIAAGKPMRNSTAVLQAIKMKMEYTISKPAQKVDADSKVTVEVVTLGPETKKIEVVAHPDSPTVVGEEPNE